MGKRLKTLTQMLSNPQVTIDERYSLMQVDLTLPVITCEHDLQAVIIAECDKRAAKGLTDYGNVFAIPNGQVRKGQRLEPGIRSGYPDLGWDLPRIDTLRGKAFHGLRIELKFGKNQLEQEQKTWSVYLRKNGYFWALIRDDYKEAMSLLDWYYSLEPWG